MWIDTHGCKQSYHRIVDGRLYHADGEECQEAEYDLRKK